MATKNDQKRAIMFIPHHSLLEQQSLSEWARGFEQITGCPPTEIALPAIELEGPTFPTEAHTMPGDLGGKTLADWVGETHALPGIQKVWGIFNVVYAFLEGAEDLMVTDQYGITLDNNACITNPVVQSLTDRLMEDALNEGLDGIALDLTDVYPQSGSNVTNQIQDTCFCKHCIQQFRNWDFDLRPDQFTGKKNPFRLVLKMTETGTDNIPIRTDWLEECQADRLVTFSQARQFITPEDANAMEDATFLLNYVDVRRHAVAQSAKRLTAMARERGKATAAILGESNLDLTTMTDLCTVHDEQVADEYWLPEVRVLLPSPSPTLCRFMASRATYGVNAFFEIFREGPSWLATRGPDFVIRQVALRKRRTMGVRLTRASVFTTSLSQEYAGFIGIPLRPEDFQELTRKVLERILAPVVPRETLRELTSALAAGGLPGTTEQ